MHWQNIFPANTNDLTPAQAADAMVDLGIDFTVPVSSVTGDKRPMKGARWKHGAKPMGRKRLAKMVARGGGLALPLPAGITVIDLDNPDGSHEGFNNFIRLLDENDGSQDCLDTLTVLTPREGFHLYFRSPLVVNNAGRVAPSIDIRSGPRGLVVIPPSLTPLGKYELFPGEIQPIPQWLGRLVNGSQAKNNYGHVNYEIHELPELSDETSTEGKDFLKRMCAKIAQALEGYRNDSLNAQAFVIARAVAGGSVAPQDAISAIHAAATESGLTDQEVDATMRSAYDAGLTQPLVLKEADGSD